MTLPPSVPRPASRFAGTVVVITGVGREGQVGDAVASAFAGEGATVHLIGHQQAEVEARAAAIVRNGGRAWAYGCDLTDMNAASDAARRILGRVSSGERCLDALVNVAGGFAASGPLGVADVAVLDQQIKVNLITAWVASNALLPLVKNGGSIVFFGSALALPGAPTAKLSAYAASKAGVLAIMQAAAHEGRDRGVRANAVAPETIRTPQNEQTMGTKGRFVEMRAVTDAALFLCSNESAAMTGQVLRLGS